MYYDPVEEFFMFIFVTVIFCFFGFWILSAMDSMDTSEMCVTVNTKTHEATWLETYHHSYFGIGLIWDKPDKTTYPQKGTAKYVGEGRSMGFNRNVPDVAAELMRDLLEDAPQGAPGTLSDCR